MGYKDVEYRVCRYVYRLLPVVLLDLFTCLRVFTYVTRVYFNSYPVSDTKIDRISHIG